MPTGGMFLLTCFVFATLEPVGIKEGGREMDNTPQETDRAPSRFLERPLIDPRSEIRDPRSETQVRDPRSEIRDPKSG